MIHGFVLYQRIMKLRRCNIILVLTTPVTLPTSYKVDTSVNTHEYTLQLIARVARIECIHVTSLCAKTRYELITSVFTRHEWWRRHHLPERSQTRNEYFLARVVPRVRHTRVFVKCKSSCTVLFRHYS